MKKRVCILLLTALLIALAVNSVYATEVVDIMGGVSTPAQESKVEGVLAYVIKLIQIAGSGIALVVVTLYGIKYMLASPAEKADVKKQILPIIIGCALVFGTVNLVSIVADLAGVLN